MKKLLYIVGILVLAACFQACENEVGNPGDFSKKCELRLGEVVSQSDGLVYNINVVREIDTVYQHFYVVYDTLRNSDGTPVLRPDGRPELKSDTLSYNSNYTARYYECEPITLPSKADTFSIDVYSNSRWFAPVPDNLGLSQWFFDYNSSLFGGGDGKKEFRVARNRTTMRRNPAGQIFFTQDTTVMVKLVFNQKGERDK